MTSAEVPDLYPNEPLPVRLANTVWADRDGVHDALETVAELEQWARQCGLSPDGALTIADLTAALALRDSVRRLAAEALDDTRHGAVSEQSPATALGVLNGMLGTLSPTLSQDADGYQRTWSSPAGGFEQTLAEIALEAADLLSGGATRLGACHGPGCVLYFERRSAKRGWCSDACGNRARVARHYQRHKR